MAKHLDKFTKPFQGSRIPFLLAEVITNGAGEMVDMVFRELNAPAAALLNAPEAVRKSKGDLPDVQPDEASLRAALRYEYAIEIDGAGSVFVPFSFMRRHDLLIGGTPTEYPIPQTPLEVVGIEGYSFGGREYAGETGIWGELGTARDNGWKPADCFPLTPLLHPALLPHIAG